MITKNCLKCNKEFKTYPSRLKRKGRGQFCSISCSMIGTTRSKGHKMTKEVKEKVIKNLLVSKGEKHWNWKGGIHKDISHRRKLQMIRAKRHLYLKRGNGGSYTLGEWDLLKLQYGYTCPSCKKQEPVIKLTVDHIIPLSKGGSNNIENIQPLCGLCNSTKNAKLIDKFDY